MTLRPNNLELSASTNGEVRRQLEILDQRLCTVHGLIETLEQSLDPILSASQIEKAEREVPEPEPCLTTQLGQRIKCLVLVQENAVDKMRALIDRISL